MSGKSSQTKASVTALPNSDERETAGSSKTSELEQIQDILFGNQSRTFETNLKTLENEFAARLEKMSEAMDVQFEQLNAQLARQREQIQEQIAQTQQQIENSTVSKQSLSALLNNMASAVSDNKA